MAGLLSPAKALRTMLQTDCCGTGVLYQPVSVKEIKQFKEACSAEEYTELGEAAALHLHEHGES